MTFTREYIGTWFELPEPDRLARIIWLRYEVDTESFDRTLRGAWHPRAPDEWIPAPWDMPVSRDYAWRRRREAIRELSINAIADDVSETARREVQRLSFEKQKEWLEGLLRPKESIR